MAYLATCQDSETRCNAHDKILYYTSRQCYYCICKKKSQNKQRKIKCQNLKCQNLKKLFENILIRVVFEVKSSGR